MLCVLINYTRQIVMLLHGFEYNIINIFRASHILPVKHGKLVN